MFKHVIKIKKAIRFPDVTKQNMNKHCFDYNKKNFSRRSSSVSQQWHFKKKKEYNAVVQQLFLDKQCLVSFIFLQYLLVGNNLPCHNFFKKYPSCTKFKKCLVFLLLQKKKKNPCANDINNSFIYLLIFKKKNFALGIIGPLMLSHW